MKKSILALSLVAILSMLGACSSDNDDGPSSVQGNLAKEPISEAKLEIWTLGEVGVSGKKAHAEAVTSKTGQFNFGVDPAKVYVVKIATGGLATAKVMNKAGGSTLAEHPEISAIIKADTAVIVPANSPAQLNPIGIAATLLSGIPTTGALSAEQVKQANAIVASHIDTIATNLAVMSSFTNYNVNKATILSGQWSANLEYAMQLGLMLGNFDALADPDRTFTPAEIATIKASETAAIKKANDAASATGLEVVKSETVDNKLIIKTYLFNSNGAIIPAQINASNATAYSLNATAYGANSSLYAAIIQNTLVATNATLIPASSVDVNTIDPINKGISAKTGKSKQNFGLDITATANGSYSVVVRASYANGTNTQTPLVINLGTDNSNATILQ